MKKNRLFLAVGTVALVAAAAIVWVVMNRDTGGSGRPDGSHRPEATATADAKQAAKHANDFGFRLFRHVVKGKEQENVSVSGISAAIALALVHEGCEGDSRKVLADALGYGGPSDGASAKAFGELLDVMNGRTLATVRMANAVLLDKDHEFEAEFLKTAKGPFRAEVQSRDLQDPATSSFMNDWASKQTEGMIPKLMGEITDDTFVVLLNALYFAGDWKVAFEKEKTASNDFSPEVGESFKVPMMSGKVDAAVYSHEVFGAARMPYKGEDYSMILMMPHEGKTLSDVRAILDQAVWKECLDGLDYVRKDTYVALPKFKLSTRHELNAALVEMGLGDALLAGKANYSRMVKGMDPSAPVWGTVYQQVVVEVDESGTRAAAVTRYDGSVKSEAPAFTPVFNRPFMFAIVEHKTDAVLFLGQVMDPRKE